MAYTVKKLSDLSKVSIRTLHYYDEIDLLKPAFVGRQGYRFYEEAELLRLQQIMFFKELGFDLSQIKKILNQDDFDNIKSLTHHRKVLLQKKDRMQALIDTVDKTIKQIKGEIKMKDKEMYYGFKPEKQEEYEQYWIDRGAIDKDQLAQGQKRLKNWSKAEWQEIMKRGESINTDLVHAIENGLGPESTTVQEAVARHYQLIKLFWEPEIKADKERYSALGQFYLDHPEMKKYYDKLHSQLAEFLAESMRIFADKNL